VPLLPRIGRGGRFSVLEPGLLRVEWPVGTSSRLHLTANLFAGHAAAASAASGRLIHAHGVAFTPGTNVQLPPWSVLWTCEE